MTTNQPDRLDRMEALLERFIETSVANQREIQQLVTSNSRSIQALSDEFVEHRLTTAEERQELREAIQRPGQTHLNSPENIHSVFDFTQRYM